MGISKRVTTRIVAELKRYQTILADAKRRDISEADTVVIVGDMLADVLGYDKYQEVTAEFAIRGTYVDLAVRVGRDIRFLVEVKAIGCELKDNHVKQAIDYGANQGIEWAVLTNGMQWRIYKIMFKQPIEKVLVFETDLATLNLRDDDAIECIGTLSREGFTQSSMDALAQQKQATNKFTVAAILLSDPVIMMARRELRRLYPDVRIDDDVLRSVIENEALKREIVDGEDAKAAQDEIKRAIRAAKSRKAKAASAASASESSNSPPTHQS
jgi:predicted type IV restriction endonuclease